MSDILKFSHICKSYGDDEKKLTILNDVSFTLKKGEVAALIGPSGSGKSTMLHIAGLLDKASSGEVLIDNVQTSGLNDYQRSNLRGHDLGFIYQFHHLLPEFSALENVSMPLLIQNMHKDKAYEKAENLLRRVGLSHRLTHKPSQLSGGERQRVAIARALINEPKLLLADEPTGNLDPLTAENVFSLFMEIAKEKEITAIIATHNYHLAGQLGQKLIMENQSIIVEN